MRQQNVWCRTKEDVYCPAVTSGKGYDPEGLGSSESLSLGAAFHEPPRDCLPWTRWWWFGADLSRGEIERELTFMAEHGYGGVELAFVYGWPGAGHGPEVLSQEWISLVEFAARTAHRLGLGLDITCGSGWPFGGAHIPEELGAHILRVVPIEEGPGPGEREVAVVAAPAVENGNVPLADPTRAVVATSGAIPPGLRCARLIEAPSGQLVKRAAPGQEGRVLDHLRVEALNAHLATWGPPLLEVAKAAPIRALFCDSWEVAGPYWTPSFPEEFRKRRGYDILPLIPFVLGVWKPPQQEAIAPHVYDYRLTIHELALANFFEPFAEWCRKHGLLARVQAHGAPTEPLAAYGSADFPETETLLLPFENARLAVSAARLYGRGHVTSETFTCPYGWPNARMFEERPEDLKAIADLQFAYGVQRVIYHGFASSPEGTAWPGRYFYATTHINHHLPWSKGLAAFNSYLSRFSFLSTLGEPVTDLAVYLPIHDVWSRQDCGDDLFVWPTSACCVRVPEEVCGYTFDWVNDEAIASMDAHGGKISIRGQEYSALVLPALRYLPLETAKAIASAASCGGCVVSLDYLPDLVPGNKPEHCHLELRRLLGACSFPTHLPMPPSLETSTGPLPFQRRRFRGGEVYLIAPRMRGVEYPIDYGMATRMSSEQEVSVWVPLLGKHVARLDPWSGSAERVALRTDGQRLHLRVQVREAEPIILLITEEELPGATPAVVLADETKVEGPYTLTLPDGTTRALTQLVDWTTLEGLTDYSGTLEYEFDLMLRDLPTTPVYLDLGRVEVMAEVQLNERPLGLTLWAPHRFRLDGCLRRGANRVAVRVTNLAFNAIQAGRQRLGSIAPIPGLTDREWAELAESGFWKAAERLPSGLLGPVRLLFGTELHP